MRPTVPVTVPDSLIEHALSGNQRAIARLATRLENDPAGSTAIVSALYPYAGKAHVIGITGPPGAGKSSLLAGVARTLSQRGKRVAIVAVDPSSPKSGGATLGDRIRMSESALDANVFVRSLASRDRNDGLAPAAADIAILFDAAGYDYVFVETVGSGQDQLEVADLVHTTVLVQIPGAGDSVQLLKAGAMEIADIYVVNKSDLPGAQRVARDIRTILGLAPRSAGGWQPPIVLTSTVEESGFDSLVDALDAHARYLAENDLMEERKRRMARSELKRAIARRVQLSESDAESELIEQLMARTITPDAAAESLLAFLVQRPAER
ncbi:MAG: methylmalonyl Co-A mutase-associated GTPase MeaB [Thermomicrobiales bacterium]